MLVRIFFFLIITFQQLMSVQGSGDLQNVAPTKKCVLVVGGAGFIGSSVNKLLIQQGYETIVLDNLCCGKKECVVGGLFIEGDLSDVKLLNAIFEKYHIDVVMHFAAFIDVAESCCLPGVYYRNNLCNTINLLQAMVDHHVPLIIFSSTAAIFGPSKGIAINETHPCSPINPYGYSKLMAEQVLQDFSKAYPLKYCSLRYFNAVGGDPEGIIKNCKTVESNLVPVALRSLQTEGGSVTIFGSDYPTADGTCIRDYVHICDLGNAHILAMEYLLSGKDSTVYNLGNGRGFSVLEVLTAIEKITGKTLNIFYGNRRPGDAPFAIADPEKAKRELKWEPKYSLEMMIRDSWNALQ